MATFSLSWEMHKNSICSGLSALQQNGEFVDMTLAADGHHVKVHQMVMSLVSPYIKELLTSANCTHPVIFLNKISYQTLCAMLEYVYTGEVLIAKDNLPELIEVGKELHIQGLEDMKLEIPSHRYVSQTMQMQSNEGQPLSETGFFSKSKATDTSTQNDTQLRISRSTTAKTTNQDFISTQISMEDEGEMLEFDDDDYNDQNMSATINNPKLDKATEKTDAQIQFTISNQGALQMILNRYMYYHRYTSRKANGYRQWKCINQARKSTHCPAEVKTVNDVVVKRFGAHNHPFHDKQILKKVRDNAVFSAIMDAEQQGNDLKRQRQGGVTEPQM